tara:strand:+ start:4196 stop:4672 length:477 start_codon:yes stop_codon:yes gene_type:complete
MSETAADIVLDSLVELVVQASEQDIEAAESKGAIRYMNRFMFMLDAQGISLGYTEVSNLGDIVTIPAGAMMGLVKNLAIMLAPQYDVPVSADLAMAARDAMDAMRKLGSEMIPSQMPCTLPVGSGNEWQGNPDSHFYLCDDEGILTETSRNILLEENT